MNNYYYPNPANRTSSASSYTNYFSYTSVNPNFGYRSSSVPNVNYMPFNGSRGMMNGSRMNFGCFSHDPPNYVSTFVWCPYDLQSVRNAVSANYSPSYVSLNRPTHSKNETDEEVCSEEILEITDINHYPNLLERWGPDTKPKTWKEGEFKIEEIVEFEEVEPIVTEEINYELTYVNGELRSCKETSRSRSQSRHFQKIRKRKIKRKRKTINSWNNFTTNTSNKDDHISTFPIDFKDCGKIGKGTGVQSSTDSNSDSNDSISNNSWPLKVNGVRTPSSEESSEQSDTDSDADEKFSDACCTNAPHLDVFDSNEILDNQVKTQKYQNNNDEPNNQQQCDLSNQDNNCSQLSDFTIMSNKIMDLPSDEDIPNFKNNKDINFMQFISCHSDYDPLVMTSGDNNDHETFESIPNDAIIPFKETHESTLPDNDRTDDNCVNYRDLLLKREPLPAPTTESLKTDLIATDEQNHWDTVEAIVSNGKEQSQHQSIDDKCNKSNITPLQDTPPNSAQESELSSPDIPSDSNSSDINKVHKASTEKMPKSYYRICTQMDQKLLNKKQKFPLIRGLKRARSVEIFDRKSISIDIIENYRFAFSAVSHSFILGKQPAKTMDSLLPNLERSEYRRQQRSVSFDESVLRLSVNTNSVFTPGNEDQKGLVRYLEQSRSSTNLETYKNSVPTAASDNDATQHTFCNVDEQGKTPILHEVEKNLEAMVLSQRNNMPSISANRQAQNTAPVVMNESSEFSLSDESLSLESSPAEILEVLKTTSTKELSTSELNVNAPNHQFFQEPDSLTATNFESVVSCQSHVDDDLLNTSSSQLNVNVERNSIDPIPEDVVSVQYIQNHASQINCPNTCDHEVDPNNVDVTPSSVAISINQCPSTFLEEFKPVEMKYVPEQNLMPEHFLVDGNDTEKIEQPSQSKNDLEMLTNDGKLVADIDEESKSPKKATIQRSFSSDSLCSEENQESDRYSASSSEMDDSYCEALEHVRRQKLPTALNSINDGNFAVTEKDHVSASTQQNELSEQHINDDGNQPNGQNRELSSLLNNAVVASAEIDVIDSTMIHTSSKPFVMLRIAFATSNSSRSNLISSTDTIISRADYDRSRQYMGINRQRTMSEPASIYASKTFSMNMTETQMTDEVLNVIESQPILPVEEQQQQNSNSRSSRFGFIGYLISAVVNSFIEPFTAIAQLPVSYFSDLYSDVSDMDSAASDTLTSESTTDSTVVSEHNAPCKSTRTSTNLSDVRFPIRKQRALTDTAVQDTVVDCYPETTSPNIRYQSDEMQGASFVKTNHHEDKPADTKITSDSSFDQMLDSATSTIVNGHLDKNESLTNHLSPAMRSIIVRPVDSEEDYGRDSSESSDLKSSLPLSACLKISDDGFHTNTTRQRQPTTEQSLLLEHTSSDSLDSDESND